MTAKKILIVEDDMDLGRGLSIRLRANGYTVFIATDDIAAISVAQKELPDLILLDIGLPAGDGFTVMDRLKSITHLAVVPVVVLTGRDPLGSQQRAMDAGAMAFLQKPVDNDVLLRTIRQVLQGDGVPVQEKNGNQTAKEGAGNTVKKVLVVEDDLDLLRGLSTRLKANGYNPVFAPDGVTAVSVALKELPDVITLDIGLPGGDGFTVMERLKSHNKLCTVPIIVVTCGDSLTTRNRALSAGAQAFLLKPVDNDILLAAIQKASGGN